MDAIIMQKLGWSKELIDAVTNLANLTKKGSIGDPLTTSVSKYSVDSVCSSSLDTSHSSPAGHNVIILKDNQS